MRDEYGGQDLGRKHNDVVELIEKGLISEEKLAEYLVVANVRNPFDRMVTYYQRLRGNWTEEYLAWARRDIKRRLERGKISEDEHDRLLADRPRVEKRQRRRIAVIRKVGFNAWLQVTLIRWWFKNLLKRNNVNHNRFVEEFFPMLSYVNVAMRQEHLEQALNEVLQSLGDTESATLPRKNLTPGKKPYTSYYNAPSRFLMRLLFGKQLDYFGYAFDGVKSPSPIVEVAPKDMGVRSWA